MSIGTEPVQDGGQDGVAVRPAEAAVAGPGTRVTTGEAAVVAPRDDAVARRQGAWLLGTKARTTLLAVLAGLVAVLLVAPPASGTPRDFSVTAASVTTAMTGQTGVTQASGGYLPGTGIVLVSAVTGVTPTQLNGILAASLGPFVAEVGDLPDGEAVSWQTSLTGADGTASTWLIRVAADAVADQTRWVAVPVVAAGTGSTAAPGSSPSAGAATAGAAAAPGTSAATTSAAAAPAATAAPATSQDTTTTTATTATTGTTTATDVTTAAGTSAAAGTTGASATAVSGKQADDFAGDASAWKALTGTWAIVDGTYQQTDASGYDYISQFTSTLPAAYTVSVKMKGLGDTVNGGLIIGQPALGSRKGATIVDLASKDYIRWGSYDASSSTYKFTGGAALGAAQAAGDWHTLGITVKADTTVVTWDGTQVGTFAAVGAGSAGLVSSQSAVAFDDFTVTAS